MAGIDKNRTYTNFPTHVDNALNEVQGGDINNIQNVLNTIQSDATTLYSKNFINDCLFVLQNNPYINYMFYLDMTNEDDILKSRSNHYTYDKSTQSLYPKPGIHIATVHTVGWKSPFDGTLNDFILKVDQNIPRGATIKYYITNDLTNYYPIKANDSIPKSFTTAWWKVYVKIEFIPNTLGELPRLFGLALYTVDSTLQPSKILEDDTIVNGPDNSIKEILLQYDEVNDRLSSVVQEGSTTQLNYDESGEVSNIITTTATGISTVTLVKEGDDISKLVIEYKDH